MIECEECGADTAVKGVWKFPRHKYIARRHECKCGHAFESYQDYSGDRHAAVRNIASHKPAMSPIEKIAAKQGVPFVEALRAEVTAGVTEHEFKVDWAAEHAAGTCGGVCPECLKG